MQKETNHKKKIKQILIVEDETSLRELLSDMLLDEGFKVLGEPSAERGIKTALANHPDLILLDIILPKMDGLTMLRKLRQDKTWGETVPVIIMSNLNDQARVAEAMQLGVYDYFVKMNMQLKDVAREVREVLEVEE